MVNRFLTPEDLGRAGLDHEQRVAEVAFGQQNFARGEVAVEGDASDRSEVGLRQPREGRDRRNPRGIH